jgi:hypothetical protein
LSTNFSPDRLLGSTTIALSASKKLSNPAHFCPCGSVVEHALGKGEIAGSILAMGSNLKIGDSAACEGNACSGLIGRLLGRLTGRRIRISRIKRLWYFSAFKVLLNCWLLTLSRFNLI